MAGDNPDDMLKSPENHHSRKVLYTQDVTFLLETIQILGSESIIK